MAVWPDKAREMRGLEAAEAHALLRAAFGRPEEADLVIRLRRAGDMVLEIVMGDAGITAYAALSRMVAPEGWLCLAPVAVSPALQRNRLGSRLVRAILAGAETGLLGTVAAGPATIVVLGKPSFYARAGFSLERARRLTSPYPLDHTLIWPAGSDAPERELVYPQAFASV